MDDLMQKSLKPPNFLAVFINSTSEGIDRISYLPDDILHNILSYLYIFDVVQLSILSKRWNYIWRTMPYLNFDINSFGCERINRPWDLGMAEKFKDFINWVFINQCEDTLVCFKLCCGDIFGKGAIFRWVRVVTTRNVQELVLNFCPAGPFELPYCVVTCESLRLKFLHLEEVELSNEHLTSCLFSRLEKLKLDCCNFGSMTMVDIASTSLVYVSIKNFVDNRVSFVNCNIKISCPNLKVLKYGAPLAKDIILENLFSIEVVHLFFFDSDDVMEEIVAIDESCMEVMMLLLKHSPNLEVLDLFSDENYGWDENWKLHDPSESVVCLESHLKLIQLAGFKNEEKEIELLRFFLKNAQVLEKLIVVWECYNDILEEVSDEVSKFPRASSHVVVSFLNFKPKSRSRYRDNFV
ncbi:F-box/FBD/LRR-repeat protein At5g56420-like [Solanum tuberosum]|uniref:F-box/FBD/LRR-repeat protein At5g56420-like n=1 Tax=Solanum tuberosum TaxID=4113 RepID=UPI00073A28FA|nr:PREDICTED: F-box/FBD/LRR-repeat protein At5g56420-like [Solanum tuberosum]